MNKQLEDTGRYWKDFRLTSYLFDDRWRSRQTGDSMAITCFGVRFGGLDADVQCSNAILGEQLLIMSGAIGMEQRLMWRVMSKNLGDLKKLR